MGKSARGWAKVVQNDKSRSLFGGHGHAREGDLMEQRSRGKV